MVTRFNFCLVITGICCIVQIPLKTMGQCEERLIEQAINQSGNDALFIRDFVLKTGSRNKKGKNKFLPGTSDFEVRLNKNIIYRFVLVKEENSKAQPILKLKRANLVMGSTFDPDKGVHSEAFDFFCTEGGNYQVVMSFVDEVNDCSAGVMFAIVQDSVTLSAIIDSTDHSEILYTGIDNYIDIAASDIPGGTLEVSVSRGIIEREGGLYRIRVDEPGKLSINVIAKNAEGKITESFKSDFIVSVPVLPGIMLAGSSGGIVKKSDIFNSNQTLEILSYRKDIKYSIKRFTVSKKLSLPGIVCEEGNKLNFRQINLIKELTPGETFYIMNIEIQDSNGQTYQLQPIGYIVGE